MSPANSTFAAAHRAGATLVRSGLSNEAFHIGSVFASYFSCIGWLAIHRASFSASSGCWDLVVTAIVMPPFTPAVAVLDVPGAGATAICPATLDLVASFRTE